MSQSPLQNVIAIDLEMNQDADRRRAASQENGPIIQIGATIGNIRTGEILARFSRVIDTGEPVALWIEELTGVGDLRVKEEGVSLGEAYADLKALCANFGVWHTPLQWGVGDASELRKNLIWLTPELLIHEPFIFGHRWLDVKAIFQALSILMGDSPHAGLKKALGRFGLSSAGRSHDARVDAENTFLLFRELILLFPDFCIPADPAMTADAIFSKKRVRGLIEQRRSQRARHKKEGGA